MRLGQFGMGWAFQVPFSVVRLAQGNIRDDVEVVLTRSRRGAAAQSWGCFLLPASERFRPLNVGEAVAARLALPEGRENHSTGRSGYVHAFENRAWGHATRRSHGLRRALAVTIH